VGLYTNERDVEGNLPLPTTFTEISLFDSTTGDPELDQLLEGGWTFLDK
jgi:hypothetical protein